MKSYIYKSIVIVCFTIINNFVWGQKIVENVNYNSGNYTFNDLNSVISPTTQLKPVLFSGASKVSYLSSGNIQLNPGFEAKNHTTGGVFEANIYSFMQSPTLPSVRDSNVPFYFGVHGLPFSQQWYWGQFNNPDYFFNLVQFKSSIDNQLELIKKLGLTFYRIGIHADTAGNVLMPWANTDGLSHFYAYEGLKYLHEQANSKGIKLLIVIGDFSPIKSFGSDKSTTEFYNIGRRFAVNFVSKNGEYFDYYELSNELDIGEDKLKVNGCPGANKSDFSSLKISQTAAYLKGLHDGIKQNYPNSKTIVNSSGYQTWGFFDALSITPFIVNNQTLLFNDFDIIGWHFYSDQGDLNYVNPSGCDMITRSNSIEKLKNILPGKKIWITEINVRKTDDGTNSQDKIWLDKNFNIAYKDPMVEALFLHELYDRKFNFSSSSPFYSELFFGLVECNQTNCVGGSLKPSFYNFQSEVEKKQYGYEDLITSWYIDLACNNGNGDPNGKMYWINYLKTSQNIVSTAKNLLNTDQYANLFVNNAFLNLLGRNADASGLSYYANIYKNGKWEDIVSQISTSSEIWTKSGGTTTQYITWIYLKLLGRNVMSSELASWGAYLGATPSNQLKINFIGNILQSDEYLNNYLNAQYSAYLNRSLTINDEGNRLYYLYALRNNQKGLKDVVVDLMSSQEYFDNAIKQGYAIHHPDNTLPTPVITTSNSPIYIYPKLLIRKCKR